MDPTRTKKNLDNERDCRHSSPVYTGKMVVLSSPEPIPHAKNFRTARDPNALTRKAMADANSGTNLVRCENAVDLFSRLGI